MENFLKDNWFKIIISVAVLIVAGSVGYYFISLPNQQGQKNTGSENIVDLQAKCTTQAEKTLNDFKNSYINIFTSNEFSQRNHYNKKLNKCFVLISPVSQLNNSKFNIEVLSDGNNWLAIHFEGGEGGGNIINTGNLWLVEDKIVSYSEYTDFINQKMELSQ